MAQMIFLYIVSSFLVISLVISNIFIENIFMFLMTIKETPPLKMRRKVLLKLKTVF